jgi:peptidoglycan/LPS O-acetylase OafA/YrhL
MAPPPMKPGGQIALGVAATAVAVLALWSLKWIENRLRQERRALFAIEIGSCGPQSVGCIVSAPILGRLHHHYARTA